MFRMANEEDLAAEEHTRRTVLVAANLFEQDPEMIDGLVYPVPADRRLSSLLRDYDTQRTTNRKVRCAVCPTHTKHYRGFVGQLDDDSLALIGIDCGEQRFGKGAWAEMSAKLKRAQDEAHYQARIEPARKQIAIVYPLLQQWRDALGEWLAFRAVFAQRHEDLFSELREAAVTNEGRLTRERMAWVTVVDEQGNPRKERQPQTETYGRIPYPEGFASRKGDRRLLDAGECLKKANRILADKRDLKSLAEAFRILRDGRKAIDDVEEFHQGWIRNASIEWWGKACDWYNSVGGPGRMRLNGRRLIRANDGNPIVVPIPAPRNDESLFGKISAEWPR